MALFTMPRMGLENGISTTETDSYSRIPMGFHRLTRSNSRSQGFTLIELLITVAILGIFAAIATPSLQNFVLNNRIRTQAAALTSSLAFARTEAITRGTRVVACPGTASDDDRTCAGIEWESGWLVFVDKNDNKTWEIDELLEVHGPLDGNAATLRGYGDVTSKVTFFYDGRAEFPGTFELCDQRGKSYARAIQVLATGRTRTLTDSKSSDWPNDCKKGAGSDKKGATAKKALHTFLNTNKVRTFKTNKKKKPIQPGKKTGSIGKKKRWKSDFEQGVYFDQLLDWQKSTGKGNPGKTKKKRDNSFRLTDKKVDPAIVNKYILLKEATGALYIPK